MNKWRRHIATGSVVMALGVASMVPTLALAATSSYGNQDTGTSSSQQMKSHGGQNMGADSNQQKSESSGSNWSEHKGTSGKSNGQSMGSESNTNSGGSMGSESNMNSGGSMSSGMSHGGVPSTSKSTVKQVQKALNQAGYNVSVDGVQGPQTTSALQKYQQSHGLQASGKLTPQTMQKLGVSQ